MGMTQGLSPFKKFRIIQDHFGASYLDIVCKDNQTIIIEIFKEKLQENKTTKQLCKISIQNCRMSIPMVKMVDILKSNNHSISEIVLDSVTFLEAQHLTGIDEKGIKLLILDFSSGKEPLPLDLFSNIPSLPLLNIFVQKAEYLPDLSKLPHLNTIHIEISLSGSIIRSETGESFFVITKFIHLSELGNILKFVAI